MNIDLPYRGFKFRDYQKKLFDYLMSGGNRAFCLWHRRSGKDEAMLHITLIKMLQRKGTYWYVFPTYSQARKAVWKAVDPHHGRKRIEGVIPFELIKNINNTEMSITLFNGSNLQFVGSDRPDDLRGSSPCGIIISEYAKVKPTLYDEILSPILEENKGWIVFNTTPSGRNHAFDLWESMKRDSSCFTSKVTVNDSGIFSDKKIKSIYDKVVNIDEEYGKSVFSQEYLCSFESPRSGSYYGNLIQKARDDGRVLDMHDVPFFRDIIESDLYEMMCAMDLGVDDSTALWFFKRYENKIFVFGYHEARRLGAQDYADYIRKNYPQVRRLVVPHDARVKEWGSGKTRVESLIELKFRPIVCPSVSLSDGIFATRETFNDLYFDENGTKKGLEALSWYHQEYNDSIGAYDVRPKHDWSSHAADAFRYLCLWCKKLKNDNQPIHTPVFSSANNIHNNRPVI